MIIINKVVLIGRLTKDPELKFTPNNGAAVCSITLAVDKYIKGEKSADYIPVVIWGKSAENTANFTSKGRLLGVSGKIQVRNYDAKDGTKRYVTEVVAEEVSFLDSKQKQNNNTNSFDMEMTPTTDGDSPF